MDELTMQHVSLRMDKTEDYRIKEAFKTLRTNIEFSGADLKVIAVTSCTPKEETMEEKKMKEKARLPWSLPRHLLRQESGHC